MGQRGPKSNAPGGYGHVTKEGYRRMYDPVQRRHRMEHDIVWENHRGPIPPGHDVHHVNANKLDNRIENLELLTPLAHKRHHSGCIVRDAEWWKPCRKCHVFYAVSHYYVRPDGICAWCRKCCVENAVKNKQLRRLAR